MALGDQDPSLYILAAGLVVGLLVTLGMYLALNNDLDKQNAKVAQAKKEVKELEKILEEVEDFKEKRNELNRKIEIIEELKQKRRGPMEVMDSVSRALPDLVWLSSMSMKGLSLSLRGTAMNTNAIATYIENLKAVSNFKEPDTKNVRRAGSDTYTFELTFKFELPQKPEDEETDEDADEAA